MSTRSSARRSNSKRQPSSDPIDTENIDDVAATGRKRRPAARKATSASATTPPSAAKAEEEKQQEQQDDPWYVVFTKNDEQYKQYMAEEWGMEKRGDVPLFEKLSLEGAQSGLSWLTILRKRDAYRRVFHGFAISKVAAMTDMDVQAIVDETNDDTTQLVVRHRGKIESVINNAKCILQMRQEHPVGAPDSDCVFDKFLWSFVNDAPIVNAWDGNLGSAPSKSEESIAMSKALKKRGFKFVGPTTCYALMQGVGMVIDYPVGSPERAAALERLKNRPGGFQDRSGS